MARTLFKSLRVAHEPTAFDVSQSTDAVPSHRFVSSVVPESHPGFWGTVFRREEFLHFVTHNLYWENSTVHNGTMHLESALHSTSLSSADTLVPDCSQRCYLQPIWNQYFAFQRRYPEPMRYL
jgi:hypothetical protein